MKAAAVDRIMRKEMRVCILVKYADRMVPSEQLDREHCNPFIYTSNFRMIDVSYTSDSGEAECFILTVARVRVTVRRYQEYRSQPTASPQDSSLARPTFVNLLLTKELHLGSEHKSRSQISVKDQVKGNPETK